ncbi:MAG: RNA polymerase sigma-54 factor, partial [Halanaerobiales bacterium]
MDLGFDLNLEQKQQLIMTPKLQTAIKILQYNSQELAEYIEEEVNENPLLELIEDKKELDYDQVSSTDFNETNSTNYENYVAYRPNLYEYLEKQLYQVLDKSKLYIGEYIVGNLNEHGFLEIAVTEIAAKYNVSVKAVNGILEKIQYLDPIGIAARNIKESLLIQLKSLKIHTKTAEEIVENYMDELAEGKYRLIKKKIGKNKKEVLAAINLIKTLNPYPVSDFYDKKETEYILPDLIIKELDGKFVVISNEKTSPGLKINSYYYRMLKNKV